MPTYTSLHPLEMPQVLQNNVNLVILRLTAAWCGPCKRVEPVIEAWPYRGAEDIAFYNLDIDQNVDIYSFLKSKRRVNGVPAVLCYSRGNISILPDEFVSSGDPKDVARFFDKAAVLWQRNRELNSVVLGELNPLNDS